MAISKSVKAKAPARVFSVNDLSPQDLTEAKIAFILEVFTNWSINVYNALGIEKNQKFIPTDEVQYIFISRDRSPNLDYDKRTLVNYLFAESKNLWVKTTVLGLAEKLHAIENIEVDEDFFILFKQKSIEETSHILNIDEKTIIEQNRLSRLPEYSGLLLSSDSEFARLDYVQKLYQSCLKDAWTSKVRREYLAEKKEKERQKRIQEAKEVLAKELGLRL